MSTLSEKITADAAAPDRIDPSLVQDAHRAVALAVQRGLAAHWEQDLPRLAVIERNGIATVYVSTVANLNPSVRADIRGAVRSALAEYVRLAPFTNVVFLTRGRP
jgi:hypothetical protein